MPHILPKSSARNQHGTSALRRDIAATEPSTRSRFANANGDDRLGRSASPAALRAEAAAMQAVPLREPAERVRQASGADALAARQTASRPSPSTQQVQRLARAYPVLANLDSQARAALWQAGEPLLPQFTAANLAALGAAVDAWQQAATPPGPAPAAQDAEMSAADAYAVAMAIAADFPMFTDEDGQPYANSPVPEFEFEMDEGEADAAEGHDDESTSSDSGSSTSSSSLSSWGFREVAEEQADSAINASDPIVADDAQPFAPAAPPASAPPAADGETVMVASRHALTAQAVAVLLEQVRLPCASQALAPLIVGALEQHRAAMRRTLARADFGPQRLAAQKQLDEAELALRAYSAAVGTADEMGPIAANEHLAFLQPHALGALDFLAHIWWAIQGPVGDGGQATSAPLRASLRRGVVRALADCMEEMPTPAGGQEMGRCCPAGYVQRLLQVVSGHLPFNCFDVPTPGELLSALGAEAFADKPAPSAAELAAFDALARARAQDVYSGHPTQAQHMARFITNLEAYLQRDYGWSPQNDVTGGLSV